MSVKPYTEKRKAKNKTRTHLLVTYFSQLISTEKQKQKQKPNKQPMPISLDCASLLGQRAGNPTSPPTLCLTLSNDRIDDKIDFKT